MPRMSLALAMVASSARGTPVTKERCFVAADRGQEMRDAGKLRAARDELLACANETCPGLVRADCTRWLAEIDARIPMIILRARDERGGDLADVRVLLDGHPFRDRLDGRLATIDPGEHVLRFEHGSDAPVAVHVLVREGEKDRAIDVTFPAPATRSAARSGSVTGDTAGSRIPASVFVLGGLSATGIAGFAFFALAAKRDVDHLRTTCAPRCDPSDVDAD